MPGVRTALVICTADWHLYHKPPVARSGEKDWYATQAGYLRQLGEIAAGKPIVVAGDLFDKHNPPPELINLAIEHMPTVFAIPGNHDLPNHRWEDVRKSAYWTLREAGKVVDVPPVAKLTMNDSNIGLWGFPWSIKPLPCREPHDLYFEIALVHKFLYQKGGGYPGAPEDGLLTRFAKTMTGYDLVVSGDNHQSFTQRIGNTTFVNCGSLYRRTADQRDYQPAVWVVYSDGSVEPKYLDISQDVFDDSHLQRDKAKSVQVGELADYLKNVRQDTADFDEAVRRVIRDKSIKTSVRDTLQELLDG